jgi:hypothetical protein
MVPSGLAAARAPLRPDSFPKTRQGFVAQLTGDIAGFWRAVFHFGTSMEKLSDGTGPSRTLKIANVREIILAIRALGLPGRGKLQPWLIRQLRSLTSSTAQPAPHIFTC